jgi:hypothetical protein
MQVWAFLDLKTVWLQRINCCSQIFSRLTATVIFPLMTLEFYAQTCAYMTKSGVLLWLGVHASSASDLFNFIALSTGRECMFKNLCLVALFTWVPSIAQLSDAPDGLCCVVLDLNCLSCPLQLWLSTQETWSFGSLQCLHQKQHTKLSECEG